jgi:hypothetical protein
MYEKRRTRRQPKSSEFSGNDQPSEALEERRDYRRFIAKEGVMAFCEDEIYGIVKDISLGGIFFQCIKREGQDLKFEGEHAESITHLELVYGKDDVWLSDLHVDQVHCCKTESTDDNNNYAQKLFCGLAFSEPTEDQLFMIKRLIVKGTYFSGR